MKSVSNQPKIRDSKLTALLVIKRSIVVGIQIIYSNLLMIEHFNKNK